MNDDRMKRKEIAAYTLMTVLILLSGSILFWMDLSKLQTKMRTENRIRLDSVAEMIQYMEGIRDSSRSSFEAHHEKDLRFMSGYSADHAAEDKYPEQLQVGNGWEEPYAYLKNDGFLEMAEGSFDGVLLLSSAADEQLSFSWKSASLSDTDPTIDPGLLHELITGMPRVVSAAGLYWLCTYSRFENGDTVLIWLMPLRSLIMRSLLHISLTLVSELIILVTILTYFFSVLKYSKTHKLTKQQIVQYHPKRLRRIVLMLGLAGALTVFICMAVFQTLDALHEESIIGAKRISRLFEYVGKTVSESLVDEKQQEEKWYVDHGERIASLIAWDPEAVSREQLQEYCDLFDIDYIMLFDPDGIETVSSADYVGFTMDAGLGENSADFRRLLKGIPSIIHKASFDPVTELERQFIGVRVPLYKEDGTDAYGALIMAIRPNMVSISEIDILGQFHFLNNEDRLDFYTDQETGKILYSSDRTLVGKTAMECGLPERSLLDGYTDFTVFNGVGSYVTMVKQSAVDFFYVFRSSVLFSSTLPMAFAALVCYLLTSLILGLFCLKGYNADNFEIMTGDEKLQRDGKSTDKSDNDVFTDFTDFSELPVSKDRSDIRWADKTPDSQVGTVLKIDILLIVILPLFVYLRSYRDSSLFWFIMNGSWMRGVNMFAFCAVMIISISGVLLLMLSGGILSLVAGFTGRSGETACRMIYSLIYYLVFAVILYYIFEYLGLSMSTYIASLGTASLALSIGAKDMIADILAGVLIVFERQFLVGDIVEIDGVRGRVLEIGVRSTRLLDDANDVRFISNSNIRSIVNKSIRTSANTAEFTLVTKQTLEQIEELLARELPLIGQKSDVLISGPDFGGIVKVSGGGRSGEGKAITVCLYYECQERDTYEARNFVVREFCLLCEREEIGLYSDSDYRQRFMFRSRD